MVRCFGTTVRNSTYSTVWTPELTTKTKLLINKDSVVQLHPYTLSFIHLHPHHWQQSKKREAVTGISVPLAKSKTLAFALARRPMDRVDLARLVNKVTPSLRLVALDGLTDASNVGTIVWPDGGEGDYGWTWWEDGRSDLVMN